MTIYPNDELKQYAVSSASDVTKSEIIHTKSGEDVFHEDELYYIFDDSNEYRVYTIYRNANN